MNNNRRKIIDRIAASLGDLLVEIENLKTEEEESWENLPEGLQQSERGECMQEAASNLSEAYDAVESARDYLETAKAYGVDEEVMENAIRSAEEFTLNLLCTETPYLKRDESETPTPYAVRCWNCNNGNLVYMSKKCYTAQMSSPYYKWVCPRCGQYADWDTANYEAQFVIQSAHLPELLKGTNTDE